jgi:hypothetical protein
MEENQTIHWTTNPDLMDAYIFHRLKPDDVTRMSEHLQICEECRQRVQEERELLAGIRRFGRAEIKHRLRERVRRDRSRRFEWTQIASLAAAIVVMLGAVFAIRWFINVEESKTRSREIVFSESKQPRGALWIIGKVIEQKDKSRGYALSKRGMPLEKEEEAMPASKPRSTVTIAPNILVRRGNMKELPPAMRSGDASVVHTLLERTPAGLRLTFYSDVITDTVAKAVYAVTSDSIVVSFSHRQIVYHIPGGWGGKM